MTRFTDTIGHIENKPWGQYAVLDQGEGFQVKRIEVEPGQRLSLQSHNHRKEFWIIVQGVFEITLDDEIKEYQRGDVVQIEIGIKHRPKCISEERGIFIEVQQGDNLREDDIIRYEDDYGRR